MVKPIPNLDLLEARLRSLSVWTISEILEKEYCVSGSAIRQLNASLAEQGIVIASCNKGYKRIYPPKLGEELNDEDKDALNATLSHYCKRGVSIFEHVRNIERKFYRRYSQPAFVFDGEKTPMMKAKEEIEQLFNM